MNGASALLPALLAVPLVGAILLMLLPKEEAGLSRGVALGVSLVTFAVSLVILVPYDTDQSSMQMVFDKEWIPGLGARFKLGIDGISIFMVLLTTFLTPIILLSAHKAITTRVREFCAVVLILEVGMLGAFLALDLFLFYIFWEIMLIPMYLLIGIWGGQRRVYASIKFVIYTMLGSLLMLVAIFYLYTQYGAVTGEYTLDLMRLNKLILPHDAQLYCFAAFALAFAIKVPLFPLHTWLPDAHVQAPTAGSVVLAGVLLKFGIYGFLRFAMPLFPYGAAELAPYIAYLAVGGIVYGAFVAFAQSDVKKLVAYSSVSHLGFCMIGLFALNTQGINGSIFAMISHGLTTSGLFLAIGVVYERRHTREMSEFGGLWKQMPVFGGLFMICMLGSVGLPGLSGFVGEFLTIFGTFISDKTFPAGYESFIPHPMMLAAVATSGVIFGAVYLLYMFQKMMFGPLSNEKNKNLKDLSLREIAVFTPLVLGIFAMGLYPKPFLDTMEPTVEVFITDFKEKLAEPDGPARLKGQPVGLPENPPDLPPPAAATPPDAKAAEAAKAAKPAKDAPGHEGHGH
jgi:NADH-quinone oxidoreductase subunit M